MNTKAILESYFFRDIEAILKNQGLDGKVLAAIKAELWKPELLNELDEWSRRYLTEDHIWGDNPSVCGKHLINELDPPSLVLDFGCGYGRDSKALLKEGHRVQAFDNAKFAIIEAQENLEEYIENKMAHVTRGDLVTSQVAKQNFDAVLSHRTLHLPNPQYACAIIEKMAHALKPNGILSLTARSPEDFNSKQMTRIDDNTAVYKDRPKHLINFYDEERFRSILSKQFTNLSFNSGEEIESMGNLDKDGQNIMSQYIHVTAHKKTDQELAVA